MFYFIDAVCSSSNGLFSNGLFSLFPHPLLPKWEQGSRSFQSPSPKLGRGI